MRKVLGAWLKGRWCAAALTAGVVVTLTVTGSTPAIAAPANPAAPAVTAVNAGLKTTYYTGLINAETGRCLDSNLAGNVYTNPCQYPGNPYQDWQASIWLVVTHPGVTHQFFSFRDYATDRCLDSNAAGNLYTLPCQAPGNPYQTWWPADQNLLSLNVYDGATSRCLDSNSAGNAYTLPCNGGPFQEWSQNEFPASLIG